MHVQPASYALEETVRVCWTELSLFLYFQLDDARLQLSVYAREI